MWIKKQSPASVLKLVWLFVCLGLMAWQIYRCSEEFYTNPVVTNINNEKFSDEFLPQITVCPRAKFTGQEVKQDELARHGLDMTTYLTNFEWKSKNRSLNAEKVLSSITWGIGDLVSSIGQGVVGEDFKTVKINKTLQLWTPTIWHGTYMTCYKFDLMRFKEGTGRLKTLVVYSKFPGGINIFLHKVDQLLDKSLRVKIAAPYLSASPEILSRYYLERVFDVSLKVVKKLSTGKHPCSTGSFDKEMLKIATEKMMTEVGCVLPFLDRVEGAPICSNAQDGGKAFDIYNNFINLLGLYEREDSVPPCECYITTFKKSTKYKANDNYNFTVLATLEFSTQVSATGRFQVIDYHRLISLSSLPSTPGLTTLQR